jgi:hypothetical protein
MPRELLRYLLDRAQISENCDREHINLLSDIPIKILNRNDIRFRDAKNLISENIF